MAGKTFDEHTDDELIELIVECGGRKQAGQAFGMPETTFRRNLERRGLLERVAAALKDGKPVQDGPAGFGAAKTYIVGDEATIISEASPELGDLDGLIRARGLDPDEWVVVSTTLNEWDALAQGENEKTGEPVIVKLRQLKVSLRRLRILQLVTPAVHVPELVEAAPVNVSVDEPDLIFVEGDHQAPYHDPGLDAAATRMTFDLKPTEHVFLGDTGDYATISRHDDHPAAMAAVQESIDHSYGILRRRADASPGTRRRKLKGNHDWRLESELLKRAERMHGICPAEEDLPALSLRRLLHLDRLGVELVEDVRGWQHAEIELVPGRDGLVVRHGFVTGNNTAGRSLDKLGRSVIVGHDHGKTHIWKLDYPEKVLRQAAVVGTMSRVDGVFPHFTVEPDWHQGLLTVSRWRDGRFVLEHATYEDGALYWRDRRIEAT